MKVNGETSSVIAGLAIGIAVVILFATFFGQRIIPIPFFASLKPDLNHYKVQAVKIALQDPTFMNLFEGKEPALLHYRDHGVGHTFYNCVPTCAIMLFSVDRSDPKKGSALVFVNPVLGKVWEIRVSENLLFAKIQEITEVKAFLTKYPDANVIIQTMPDHNIILFEEQKGQGQLALVLKTTPDGELVNLYIECNNGSEPVIVTNNVSNFIETTTCMS